MPRICTVCRCPDLATLDSLLVSGHTPLRDLAGTYSVSASALQRHKLKHIAATLSQARQSENVARSDSLLTHVRELQGRSAAILEKAEHSGDLRTALAALRELRGILELLGRLATKAGAMIEVVIVEEYVNKVVDLFHEFVPADRVDVALAKLNEAIELEMTSAYGAISHQAAAEEQTDLLPPEPATPVSPNETL